MVRPEIAGFGNCRLISCMADNLICETKSEKLSSLARRSLPSFCFGFIALALNSYKSWSFPTRTKLAKLGRSLNRFPRKVPLILPFTL